MRPGVGRRVAKTDSTGSRFVDAAVSTTSAAPTTTTSSEPTTTTPTSGAADQGVKVTITSPASVDTIGGNVVTLALAASGVQIVKADGDTSGKTGHFHVFVDRDPPAVGAVIPKEPGIIHTAESSVVVRGLSIGPHRFVLVLADGTHHRLTDAQASTTVSVTGPSVTLSAPATVPNGAAAVVNAKVDGVTLVAADGDTSGKTGHLHFFIDRQPTPQGQAIPKEAGIVHTAETQLSIPGLAPGPHVVIVVVGDGTHKPFDPPVQAEASFTVQ